MQKRVLVRCEVIFISPGYSRKPGVGIRFHFTDFADRDIAGQKAVEIPDQVFFIETFSRKIKMCHHFPGMHAGVGSARPCHFKRLTQNDRKSILQNLLHTNTVGLYLPTHVILPVV
ncbi:hypothetical protein SDC9_198854 [bioreactor metagenome]|uniref:Uncharacterized protein n=1 Tax=bioreactor metagenome TaxID=1076179 RepID=A0A645IK22_9ZZZZ